MTWLPCPPPVTATRDRVTVTVPRALLAKVLAAVACAAHDDLAVADAFADLGQWAYTAQWSDDSRERVSAAERRNDLAHQLAGDYIAARDAAIDLDAHTARDLARDLLRAAAQASPGGAFARRALWAAAHIAAAVPDPPERPAATSERGRADV